MSNTVCTTKNVFVNPHRDEIKKIIDTIDKARRDQYKIVFSPETTDEMLVDLLSIGFFTNLVQTSFSDRYMKQFPCHDCQGDSTQRCHGRNEARPELIRRALKVVRAKSPTGSIGLRELAKEFFRQHIPTKFTFKCYSCHKAELPNNNVIARREATKARVEANMKARMLEKEAKLKATMLKKENMEIQKLSKKMASVVSKLAKEDNKETAKSSKQTRTYTKRK